MLQFADLVEETATYSALDGGTFTLTGALPGRRQFNIGGNWYNPPSSEEDVRIVYWARNAAGDVWELGRGRMSAGAIVREWVYRSSSPGGPYGFNAIAFSGPLKIACVAPAFAAVAVGGNWPYTSAAMGHGAVAWGCAAAMADRAMAGGEGALALGEYSLALGGDARAQHARSVALGPFSRSYAESAVFFGRGGALWAGSAGTWGDEWPENLGDQYGAPLSLPDDLCAAITGQIIARRGSDNALYSASVALAVRNAAGALVFAAPPTVTPIAVSAGVTAYAEVVDAGGGALAVRAHGEADEEWYWSTTLLITATGVPED